jgi:hypothetical protein
MKNNIDDIPTNMLSDGITIYPKDCDVSGRDYDLGDIGVSIDPRYESYKVCLYKNIEGNDGVYGRNFLYCDIIFDLRVSNDKEITISGDKIKKWMKSILVYEIYMIKMVKTPRKEDSKRRTVIYNIENIDEWLRNSKELPKDISRRKK